MPKVEPYVLPTEALHQVALSSGLHWIASNASRIAEVQAAIAAEPKPVHIPRARPAPIVLDDSPLILVETKRDLGKLHLPFEQTPTV
jgi:ribonuclease E